MPNKRTPVKFKSCHRAALEALASHCVGGKTSLWFVSINGKQAGVVTSRALAMSLARSIEPGRVMVEGAEGVVWENAASERYQRETADL